MTKYSSELKMKVVEAYLNNEGGCEFVAKKYGISNEALVRKWVNAFKSQGHDGIKISRKNNKYSFEFKQNIVKLYLVGEMSYQELANQFKLNNPSLISRWVKEFREQGLEGLKPRKRGRPSSMNNDNTPRQKVKKEYSEEEIDEIQKLKEELYWTQMELDFVKKKIELRQCREREMKKSRK